MKQVLIYTIRIVVIVALVTVFEFALPLTTYASAIKDRKVLLAQRDLLSARLNATTVKERKICEMIVCKPEIVVRNSYPITVTAYSSTPDQTYGNPFVTASGAHVRQGTFAMNGVPFGTKIRIPEYFGDRIFVVEDRMHSRYSSYRGDIWMQTRQEAIQWGARYVMVEFVEEVPRN